MSSIIVALPLKELIMKGYEQSQLIPLYAKFNPISEHALISHFKIKLYSHIQINPLIDFAFTSDICGDFGIQCILDYFGKEGINVLDHCCFKSIETSHIKIQVLYVHTSLWLPKD